MIQLPEVIGLVLCEEFRIDTAVNKASLVGLFTALRFPHFPSPPQKFVVYVALSGGVGEGIMKLVVTRLETDEQIHSYERWLAFPEDRLFAVSLFIPITHCVFEAPGRYALTLFLDHQFVTERSIPIYEG